MANLGAKDRWLDIGAGQGLAILDYFSPRYDAMHLQGLEQRGNKAQAIAISIEDRRTIHWDQTAASLESKQIQYLYGRRLREYSFEELGQFQLITDVLGGFSYTRYLSLFMEKALGLLELNGNLYAAARCTCGRWIKPTLLRGFAVLNRNRKHRQFRSETVFLA